MSALIETDSYGWLRSFSFDALYIVGIALIALAAADSLLVGCVAGCSCSGT